MVSTQYERSPSIHPPCAQIEAGVKELVKAEATQKGSRAALCIAILCALVALFLLIAIVRHA